MIEANPDSTSAKPSGSLLRWALPAALFVVIIGAIAWISQNLPKSGGQSDGPQKQPAASSAPPALQFLRTKAIWDADDENYVMETEEGVKGYYDLPFLNPNDQPITLGFGKTSCDCSKLTVAALDSKGVVKFNEIMDAKPKPVRFPIDPDWDWKELPQDNVKGIDIAAKGGGVVRVAWDGRKKPGSRLRLVLTMWMHPPGKIDDRTFENLEVPVTVAEPVRFIPYPRLSLGAIGANGSSSGQFLAYSSTRDNLKLRLDPNKIDPLFETTITPLGAKESRELQDKLVGDQQTTRVRSLYRIEVRVHEEKGGVQLDQGPFSKKLPILIDDFDFDLTPPDVTGASKGEVEIGVLEDAGRVFFKPFVSRDGASRTVPLWSESAASLEIEKFSPAYLKVELKPDAKDSKATRKRWILEVRIPPNSLIGSLPEDAVIILKTPATRRVRIPVVASAGIN